MSKINEYKKAIGALVGGLAATWAAVLAADWSTKQGIIASIVPIVSALVAYIVKNVPAAQ